MPPNSQNTIPKRAGHVSRALAANRLGVSAVTYFAIAVGAPLTIMAGAVSTGYAITGQIGIPLGFVLMGVVLGLFCVGYVTMAPHVPNAGAFNAYISKGLGRPAGVAGGWASLIAYNTMQIGFFGTLGDAAEPLFRGWFGLELSWWVYSLAGWAIVAYLGLQHIDLNGRVLCVLMIAECLVIIVYSIANLANPADGAVTVDTLSLSNLFAPGVGVLFAIAILGFVGFETTVVFCEEARNPRRTVPVATYLSLGVMTLLYALGSWSMSVATGPGRIAALAHTHGSNLIFDLAGDNLGGVWVVIGRLLYVTSVLAALIAFHNTTARYAFSLGRERLLPSALGTTSQRTSSPRLGSLAQSAVAGTVIVIYGLAGGHPVRDLFFIWTASGSLGILILIATTSVAIVVFFARENTGESAWRRVVAPVLAAAGCLTAVVLVLANFDKMLEVDDSSPLRWGVPGVYLAIAVLGVLWGVRLRGRRPDIYATIGLGAKSAAGTGLGMLTDEGTTRRLR